jgi:hypothetical protein
MDLPGAAAGAIDAVRTAYDAIMLKSVSVKLFPASSFR